MKAKELLFSWDTHDHDMLKAVRLEEDIRDALQSVRTAQPSLDQRKALLEASAAVGVQMAFLGFPASSALETARCAALTEHIATRQLGIEPIFMARALPDDLISLLEIEQRASYPVTADIFISTCALRLQVEGWTLASMPEMIDRAAQFARQNGLACRISLEDSSRTRPGDLEAAISRVIAVGAKALILCDTTGDCSPSGAANVTSFALEQIDKAGSQIEVGWHGHNDKGLGLANALSAAQAGATIISGTFMGIGERTGNIPLEQLILLMAEAGNDMYDLTAIPHLCNLFCSATGLIKPYSLPLVGSDAFSTSTGTHAAAILKARTFGKDFENLMYSGVDANLLGREQTLLIGPHSGRNAIRGMLTDLHVPVDDATVDHLLEYCKSHDRCLHGEEEILQLLQRVAADRISAK